MSGISAWKDGLHRRTIAKLKVFTDWLTQQNALGYIGEVGWPNAKFRESMNDVADWDVLAQRWWQAADAANLWATTFSADEAQVNGGYSLTVYTPIGDGTTRTISTPKAQAATCEAHLTTANYKRGIHIEPGAYGPEKSTFAAGASGTYDTDYWYPSLASYQYLYGRGHRIVRISFRWERLQPTLNAALDTTELNRLTTSVNNAGTAGLGVILDCHNYGGCYLSAGTETKMTAAGTLTRAHMVDLWSRLSTAYKNNANVLAYGLMNEPGPFPGVSSDTKVQASFWAQGAQDCVTAIRNNADTKLIMVPLYLMDHTNVNIYHPTKFITDTANNIRYEGHHYFWVLGYQGGGNYSVDYLTEVNNAANEGWFA
jgi:hypothetical protein